MNNCIFCKINKGIVPSEKLYEDQDVFIIKDANPRARIVLLLHTP